MLAVGTYLTAAVVQRESPRQPVALGIWNPGVPLDMRNHDEYVARVGKRPAVVLWYQSWGPSSEGQFCARCADKLSNEAIPKYSPG